MGKRRLAMSAALVALAVAVEWLGSNDSVWLAAVDLSVALAFLAGGMLVWRRERPEPLALIFISTGLAWLLGTLAGSSGDVLSSVGSALLYVHRGPLVLLLLAYPSGQLRLRLPRLVVALAFLDGVIPSVAQNDAATLALVACVTAAAAFGPRNPVDDSQWARSLATGGAGLVGAALALNSIDHLSKGTALSDTTLLLAYEATLVVTALGLAIGIRLLDRARPAEVANLVVELGTDAGSGTVRGALARAFADPSLELGYRVGNSYVDDEGKPIHLPESNDKRALTLVKRNGEPVAALVHDATVADDPRLVEAVAAAIRLAASNARLQAELRGQVRELGASRRRMIEAGDAQRSRLERRLRQAAELHLEGMRHAVERGLQTASADVAAALAVVQRELDEAVVEVHELARGIHPRTLTEAGLGPAIAELAATGPTHVSVAASDERFSRTIEVAAYFVCAEALANVAKYARADRASVEVQRDDARLRVVISDDGVGGADPGRGSGLRGLADRIDAVGGRLTVTSPISGGTSIVAEIPLEQPA